MFAKNKGGILHSPLCVCVCVCVSMSVCGELQMDVTMQQWDVLHPSQQTMVDQFQQGEKNTGREKQQTLHLSPHFNIG